MYVEARSSYCFATTMHLRRRETTPRFALGLASLSLLAACGARSSLDDGAAAQTQTPRDAGTEGAAGGGAGGGGGAGPTTFVSVACGGAHVCAVTSGGKVVCWGYGGRGQLGDGLATGFTHEPVVVASVSGATQVAAGGEHTCVLASGAVLCFGHDEYGQIGDGASGIGVDRPLPVAVALPEKVTAIVAGGPHFGSGHSCALGASGAVWCWGANPGGQIGNGQSGFGALVSKPFHVTKLGGAAVALAAGGNHTCAILEGGDVWCWGYDYSGQIGDGNEGPDLKVPFPVKVVGLPDKATSIAAGDGQSCAVLANGEAWCWGEGGFGEFGVGTPNQPVAKPQLAFPGAPVAAIDQGALHGCVARTSGEVACAGLDDLGEVGSGKPGPFEIHGEPVAVGVGDAVAISAGTTTTCALRSGGALSCWGDWFGISPMAISPP
jgi:alpha-tubulin suppressor-like RCC1 family protein